MKLLPLIVFSLILNSFAQSQGPPRWAADSEKVHDPSRILEENGVKRIFSTGMGISVLKEENGKWKNDGRVFTFDKMPKWQNEMVPENRGYLWAPDVVKMKDKYFLYYSVSTFGKNLSAIGLATGKVLDFRSLDWKWNDAGAVIASKNSDHYNAIDPAPFYDEKTKKLWLVFGSYWDGIFLIELDAKTGLQKDSNKKPIRLADAEDIEAGYIHQHGEYYYLFVNWGKCCRGVESTYEIRVGRSKKVTGPYLDQNGKDMVESNGKQLLDGEDVFIGPGHAAIFHIDDTDYLSHHYYDRQLRGKSRMRVLPVKWTEDAWPEVLEPEKIKNK